MFWLSQETQIFENIKKKSFRRFRFREIARPPSVDGDARAGLLQSGVGGLGRLAAHGGGHGRGGVVRAQAGGRHGGRGSSGVVGGGQVTGRRGQA